MLTRKIRSVAVIGTASLILAAAGPASAMESGQGSKPHKQGCSEIQPGGDDLLAPHGTVVTGDPSKATDKGTKKYRCDDGKWVQLGRRSGWARNYVPGPGSGKAT